MHALDDFGVWLSLLSGLAVAAFGMFVASIRPRTKANVAFVVFAITFGASFVVINAGTLLVDLPSSGFASSAAEFGFALPMGALNLATAVSLVWFALLFPDPLPRPQRRLLLFPIVAVTPFLAYSAILFFVIVGIPIIPLEVPPLAYPVLTALDFLAFGLMIAALVWVHALWALRYAAASDAASARRLAIVAGALVLYSGFMTTVGMIQAVSVPRPDIWGALWTSLSAVALLIGAGLWMRAMVKGPAPRTARNVMLLTLVMMLAGMLYAARGLDWGGHGLVRMLAVAVLTYGLVRHQLLGIDVKVRWTISKTTIAAIFVAVFFIASEAAQEFFGETLGSSYVGILAAGALVFAIAPLSRMADRLAEKAVPPDGGNRASRLARSESEEAFQNAVRLALRDRHLSRAEERDLFGLASVLGLEAGRAHEILAESEEQAAKAG